MENTEKPVQNTKKKRSQTDKVGRLKYNRQLPKRTLAKVEEFKLMLRTIFARLKGSFNFEQSLIERIVDKPLQIRGAAMAAGLSGAVNGLFVGQKL